MIASLFGRRFHLRGRFYASLATAIDSGLPLDQALGLVTEHDVRLGAAVADTRNRIAAGESLALSLAGQPAYFSRFEVDAVDAGERAGRLPDVLRRLSRYFAARGTALDRLGIGLLYPVLLLHGAVLLPPLFLLFRDGAGAYFGTVFPLLLALYGGGAGLWWLYRTMSADNPRAERFVWSLPVIGKMARSTAVADYALVFATLYSAGVPIVEALDKAAGGSRNSVLRAGGARVAEAVRSGATVADSLASEADGFPRLFIETIRVGEVAGKLEDALEKASEAAREDAEKMLHVLAVGLPVVAYVIAAGVVAVVVVRIWIGVYSGLP